MKVGFDISQTAQGGGVGVYTEELSSELSKLSNLDLVFFYSLLRKGYQGSLPNVKRYLLPPSLLEFIFNRVRFLSIENFIGDIDIYHSSDWTQPKTKAKKVTTYHDLVPIKFPQWSHPEIVDVQKRRLKIVEQEIDVVIAVSESTKKDLLDVSSISEKKIVVVYEGVSNNFKPQEEKDKLEFKKKYSLPEEFILAIKGIGERKNLERVVSASRDFNLVILGVDIPALQREELPLLYSCAKLLLYPSLYEGFGLPIIEAFACGLPVITSNISSMPEIAGNGALFVDPQDAQDIENKIKILMKDKTLRNDLIKKGIAQARKFTWEKCAEETYKVYQSLLN